jgi:Ca-activated chloride channel family protein
MVIFIGFGPDVDMSSMQKIAVQTNGEAYHALKPQDVQRILLQTIARRICAPQCH